MRGAFRQLTLAAVARVRPALPSPGRCLADAPVCRRAAPGRVSAVARRGCNAPRRVDRVVMALGVCPGRLAAFSPVLRWWTGTSFPITLGRRGLAIGLGALPPRPTTGRAAGARRFV